MVKEARGFGRDLPLLGIRQVAPGINVGANFVDDRGWVVFLLLGREAARRVEH